MTVAATPTITGPFVGTGGSATLPFTFKCFAATDILVQRDGTTLAYGGDYTVTLNADQDNSPGGSVAITAAANTLSAHVYVGSNISYAQPVHLPSQASWSPTIVEKALDRLTLLIRQLADVGYSAIVAPFGETLGLLPAKASRPGMYLAFDANGDPAVASGTGADAGLRTDLAATTGSTLVTTKRAESGAVARTLENRLRDTISVKDFGAVGDGVTDDTPAFNAAHTAAAAFGLKVHVPATASGYLVAGTIVAKAPMFGDGEATILKTNSATADVIQVGVPNVTIGDLTIQQSVTRTGGYYINFNGSTANSNYNSRVERCTFNNWYNCIGFNSVGAINTVRVRDCFLTTNVASGVGVLFNLGAGDGVDIVLRDLFIIGASLSVQPAAGVQLAAIGDITLDHVSTVYCTNGVLIQPGTGLTAEAIFINDCLFDSGTGAGIKANPSGTGTVSLLKIENAWSCTNLHGLLLSGTGFIQRVEVVGGYFCNNAGGYGINAGVVQYLDVTGGTYAANINGINITAGVSNFKIAGARCGPAGLFIQNSGFGIVIAAGASTNFSIVGCDLTGNTGGTLSNGATGASGIVVENLGVNPGPTNTITVTASPFTYTAGYSPETAYINGGTVSAVTVGGQNLGITSGAVRLGPKQSVTVTYSAAPTMVRTIG